MHSVCNAYSFMSNHFHSYHSQKVFDSREPLDLFLTKVSQGSSTPDASMSGGGKSEVARSLVRTETLGLAAAEGMSQISALMTSQFR